MKRLRISHTINRKVTQTIQLYTEEYEPWQVIEMLNSGKILTSLQPDGPLVLIANGAHKTIGKIIDTDNPQSKDQSFNLKSVLDDHWSTNLDFTNTF